jgi:hypothetical protein
MHQKQDGWSVGQAGTDNAASIPSDIQAQLNDLNRQYRNRSWWRKIRDWWLFPKGHRQIAMVESKLTIDQNLLLKIHQLQIDEAGRAHRLSMVTWLLVIIGFATLIIVIIK